MIADYLRIFIFAADVCHRYRNLTDADRRYDHKTTDNAKCDYELDGWHRFRGAAGTKMVTECPDYKTCGTNFPAWLSEDHPTVTQGRVLKAVCIRKSPGGGHCCDTTVNINVKNCGTFYVYELLPLRDCDFRYCSTD